MTLDELTKKMQDAVAAANKGFKALTDAEDAAAKAKAKADKAQDDYRALVKVATDVKAEFDAAFAESMRG